MRLTMLISGLTLFGLAMVMSLQSNLGANSWTVFHHGISKQTPLTLGTAGIVMSLLIMLVAWLMGIKPGFGTLANFILIGLWMDVFMLIVPKMEDYPARVAMLLASVVLLGFASALYIKAGFGAGPRDSLMLAVTRRTNVRVGVVRWASEITVVVIGILLGGAFGIGTIIFAFLIGPSVDIFFRLFGIGTRRELSPLIEEPAASGD